MRTTDSMVGLASRRLGERRSHPQGSVKLNDSYHDSRAYNQRLRDLVMCQEVGHVFGLDQLRTRISTTAIWARAWITRATRTEIPQTGLPTRTITRCSWTSTATPMERAAAAGAKVPPGSVLVSNRRPPGHRRVGPRRRGQWGSLISTSRDGGQSEFVLDFGNGHRVHTHRALNWVLAPDRAGAGILTPRTDLVVFA